jgi:hypothetical protein
MATLLKVLNNLADIKSAGVLHFASELRGAVTRSLAERRQTSSIRRRAAHQRRTLPIGLALRLTRSHALDPGQIDDKAHC